MTNYAQRVWNTIMAHRLVSTIAFFLILGLVLLSFPVLTTLSQSRSGQVGQVTLQDGRWATWTRAVPSTENCRAATYAAPDTALTAPHGSWRLPITTSKRCMVGTGYELAIPPRPSAARLWEIGTRTTEEIVESAAQLLPNGIQKVTDIATTPGFIYTGTKGTTAYFKADVSQMPTTVSLVWTKVSNNPDPVVSYRTVGTTCIVVDWSDKSAPKLDLRTNNPARCTPQG